MSAVLPAETRRATRVLATLALLSAAATACATTPEPAPNALPRDEIPRGTFVHARDARSIVPPARAPVATQAACGAAVDLQRASPIAFEGTLVRTLFELELLATGPAGLLVSLDRDGRPSFVDVSLAPEVALRLPAGPARDAPAGASGALFDLGGLAVAGLVNLALFPVTVPLGILAGRPDAFLMDVPTFTDGMFSDVVLDGPTWDAEVARRAAPHQAVLAKEAERQQRFAAWKSELLLEQQALSCTIDDTGRCALRVLWPSSRLTIGFSGLACAAPPPTPADPTASSAATTTASTATGTAAIAAPPPTPLEVTWLPALPEARPPVALAVPPRPADDVRGEGARATLAAWTAHGGAALEEAEARAAWPQGRARRGAKGEALHDATLVCRIAARGDFDVDGSAPELRVRIALGFDSMVAGQTFGTVATRRRTVGLKHISLLPGELVKLSLVDIDAFVDDWIGMDVVVFDGTLPLRFEHSRFTAECDTPRVTFDR